MRDPDAHRAALVLDEPANGLDPEGVHWLRGLVRGLADQGRTVLVSSHLLAEVAQTVDQVVIIDKGRVVARSTLAALTAGGGGAARGEFRHGTATPTFLVTPARGRVVAAKLVAAAGALVSAAYGLVLALLGGRLVARRDLT